MNDHDSTKNETIKIVTKKSLGREFILGNTYDIVTDCKQNDSTFSAFIKPKITYPKTQKGSFEIRCFDDECFENNLDILKIDPYLKCNFLINNFQSNKFTEFIRREMLVKKPVNLHKFLAKFELVFRKEEVNINKKSFQIFDNKHMPSPHGKHIVIEIKYGITLLAIINYHNKENFNKKTINDCINLIQNAVNNNGDLESLSISNFINNISVNFYDSLDNCYYSLWSFSSYYNKIRDVSRRLGCEQSILNRCQLEYKLVSAKSIFDEFFNDYKISDVSIISESNLSKLTSFYYLLYDKTIQLETFRLIINVYSTYFPTDYIKNFEYLHDYLTLNTLNKIASEIKQTIDINKSSNSFTLDQNFKFIGNNQLQENILAEINSHITNIRTFVYERVKDIEFYCSTGINILNRNVDYFNTYIIEEECILFGYSQQSKNNDTHNWNMLFSGLLNLKRMNPSLKCLIYDYDIENYYFDIENRMGIFQLKADGKWQDISFQFILTKSSTNENQNQTKETIITPVTEKISNQQSADEINIILLGETGIGKSTFINAFLNYTKFETMNIALQNKDPKFLIPSQFNYSDENYNSRLIQVGESKNEKFIQGQSCTQNAQEYTFELDNKIIRIIDTPGMGDTRGVEIDKKNFDETVAYLSKFKHLNAICFMVKPNISRLQPGFRYCFKELLTHLHKNCINNICFCFTNSRCTQYRPGETITSLKSYLKEIEQTSNVKIPFGSENIFCFDNEAFRFLALSNKDIKFDNDEKDKFSISWQKSAKSSQKLIQYIKTLKSLDMKDIIVMNDSMNFQFDSAKEIFKNIELLLAKKFQLVEQIRKLKDQYPKPKNLKDSLNNLTKKLNKLETVLECLIKYSSQVSYLIGKDSISVYNDDIEAYLEEYLRNEQKNSYIKNYQSKAEDLAVLLKKYKQYKVSTKHKPLDKENLIDLIYQEMEEVKEILSN